MPFEIDTGIAETDPLRLLPDWFLDLCEEPYDRPAIMKAYAQHIIGDIEKYLRADPLRRNLLGSWRFMRELADADPASFDAVLTEYAERLSQLSCASAAGRQPASNAPIGQHDKDNNDERIF